MPQLLREDHNESLKWTRWLLVIAAVYIVFLFWSLSTVGNAVFDSDIFLYIVIPLILPIVFFMLYYFEWFDHETIFKWLFIISALYAIFTGFLVIFTVM